MSALVILECNACGAITPPASTATKARELAAPEGWAIEVDGADLDYCPQCTAPANPVQRAQPRDHGPVLSRLDLARRGIAQLRDALTAIAGIRPDGNIPMTAMVSVAALGAASAERLLSELGR